MDTRRMSCLLLGIVFLGGLVHLSQAAGGPCSSTITTITVSSLADVNTRKNYSPTSTCKLVLQKNITITTSIFMDASFSCTMFVSNGASRFRITTSSAAFPAIMIRGTNNILIQGVDIYVPTTVSTADCPVTLPDTSTDKCPAVHIHSSWGVQLVTSSINGFIAVVKAPQVTLDTLSVTSFPNATALVTVTKSGNGPSMVKNQVTISNNRFLAGSTGVLIDAGAVGTVVKNNYFQNQFFTGIKCGQGVHNVGDCMLSSYTNNYFTWLSGFTPDSDSSAVYFGTHWVNQGNYLSCNYVVGGKQCLYLDYCSSGITVEGMVCYNLPTGLKLNTGHSNSITSFLSIVQRLPAWISCQNYQVNNCNQEVGQYWDQTRIASYNSAAFQQMYPWLNNFCSLSSYNGVNCNPSGSASAANTGKCSGIPTGNKASVVIVDTLNTQNTPTYLSCAAVTVAPKLNSMDWISITSSQAQFNNLANLDFGVKAGSPIYTTYPQFKSCPKSANGPQAVSATTYTNNFNVKQAVSI